MFSLSVKGWIRLGSGDLEVGGTQLDLKSSDWRNGVASLTELPLPLPPKSNKIKWGPMFFNVAYLFWG